VRDPFNNYQRGDKIKDPQLIQEILNSEQAKFVNQILLPEIQQKQFEIQPEEKIEIQSSQNPSKVSKKSKE
jgi:hypothetical protein